MFKMHFSETITAPLGCLFYQNNKDREREEFLSNFFEVWNFNDWPVGESLSLLAALSGEADGDLFLPWAPLRTFKVSLFGSSGEAGLDFMQHKTRSTTYGTTKALIHSFKTLRSRPTSSSSSSSASATLSVETSLSAATRAAKNPWLASGAFWPGIGGKPWKIKAAFFLLPEAQAMISMCLIRHEHILVHRLNKTHK